MLHEAQRTSAPSACSVSTSTAVWMVMCRLPAMRAPLSDWPYSVRMAISAGISLSAMASSLRPQAARLRSATAYWSAEREVVAVIRGSPLKTRVDARENLEWGATRAPSPGPSRAAKRVSAVAMMGFRAWGLAAVSQRPGLATLLGIRRDYIGRRAAASRPTRRAADRTAPGAAPRPSAAGATPG